MKTAPESSGGGSLSQKAGMFRLFCYPNPLWKSLVRPPERM
jgi:hypothetical protein